MNLDTPEEREQRVLRMLWDSWISFDHDGHTSIQQLMISRREVAEYLPSSKTIASEVLEALVMKGWMRKERYMLTKSPVDQRWYWLYSVTQQGLNANVFPTKGGNYGRAS
jgi:hypothetical protein